MWSYFAFLGRFSAFCGVCVGLCCSGALRGLWGFCARVWLGGLKACGVFASLFVLLRLFLFFALLLSCRLSFCPSLLWLSFVVVFLDLCFCFLFPLRYIRKKGRNFLASSLRVLCVAG